MYDVYSDTQGVVMKLIGEVKELPEFVKEASVPAKESIPLNHFADPHNYRYPCCDPATTYSSFAYYAMNGDTNEAVKNELVKRACFFEIEEEVVDFAKRFMYAKEGLQKQASATDIDGKYPIENFAHVRMAEEHFAENHRSYPVEFREKVAHHIVKRAEDFGLSVDSEDVKRYAFSGMPVCRSDQAAAEISARGFRVHQANPNADMIKSAYHRIAKGLIGNAGDKDTLYKLVETIEGLDKFAGIQDTNAPEPYCLVFNTTVKQAEDMLDFVTLGDDTYPTDTLMKVSASVYENALGEDFLEEISSHEGAIDRNKLTDILPTLPLGDKMALKKAVDLELTPSSERM